MVDDLVFREVESNVRSYCRSFPAVFDRAKLHAVFDEEGNEYIDFLAGAGALNYGHNNDRIKQAVLEYLSRDGIAHSLDLYTGAKRRFLEKLREVILLPRKLDYRVQFTGPTGTNAVEAAMKLARMVTGRSNVISFTNGFHGMTAAALSATGSKNKRAVAGIPLCHVTHLPYEGYFGESSESLGLLERLIDDPSSGIDHPAAIIVETVQAEGGVNVASVGWLRQLEQLARERGVLLIVDDIQAGCGRTGSFFSFERAGLEPDIVCLSKSIGGLGLPLALVLLRPELDQWEPGAHNGTFRGNNLAFVAAAAALDFWTTSGFEESIEQKGRLVARHLEGIVAQLRPIRLRHRGIGLIHGLEFSSGDLAQRASRIAFSKRLIVETCGPGDAVLKVLPPLTIDEGALVEGLDRLEAAVVEAVGPCRPSADTSVSGGREIGLEIAS